MCGYKTSQGRPANKVGRAIRFSPTLEGNVTLREDNDPSQRSSGILGECFGGCLLRANGNAHPPNSAERCHNVCPQMPNAPFYVSQKQRPKARNSEVRNEGKNANNSPGFNG